MKNIFLLISALFFLCGVSFAQHEQSEYRFTILHTNDEHSHLIPIPAADDHPDFTNSARGGFARLAGLVNQIRSQKTEAGEQVLLFSGGDILGGPAFGWLPLKEGMAPELTLFQKIGYNAVTIGNHEFDYGPDVYARYLQAAGYPEASGKTVILGTNTQPPENHPLSRAGIRRSFVIELENGLKAGVFGLLGEDAISKTADPGDTEFLNPIEAARTAVKELKDAGADIIISVNHSGVQEDRELAKAIPEIDVIVGGHSHTPLYEPIFEGKTIIVQAGQYLQYLGMLELSWDPVEKRVSVENHRSGTRFLKPLDHSVPVDEDVAALVSEYEQTLNEWVSELTRRKITDIRQPVAASSFPVTRNRPQRESAIGNFITDAMKKAAEGALGKRVDVAVQANGAIRANIAPGSEAWSENMISFYDLVMATGLGSGSDNQPGYPLVSFYITEDELRRALEVSILLSELMGDSYFLQFSGLQMAFNPSRAVLLRVPFKGTPIPTSRAVLSAVLETENGTGYNLQRGGNRLFHIVTDYYIAGFLPMVGEVVPNLGIQLRDESGNPVELDDTIIKQEGEQLKVWQAVVNYTLSFDTGDDGLPVIPKNYESPQERLVVIYMLPLWVWPAVILLLLITGAVYLFMRRK